MSFQTLFDLVIGFARIGRQSSGGVLSPYRFLPFVSAGWPTNSGVTRRLAQDTPRIEGIMPLLASADLSCMNTYDSKHLRLLNLILAQRWADIGNAEIHELRVLIACKYVTLSDRASGTPTIELNPEGRHYHQRLSELEMSKVSRNCSTTSNTRCAASAARSWSTCRRAGV